MGIAYGIDISDRSIELLGLAARGKKPQVSLFARRELPSGVINKGIIVQPDALVDVLSVFFDEAFGPRRRKISVGVAIPEQIIFSKVFVFPSALDETAVGNALAIEAEEVFPIEMKGATSDYIMLGSQNGTQRVYYATAEGAAIQAYADVFARAGITPDFFESESIALSRTCAAFLDENLTMFVDIGGKTASIFVAAADGPVLSGSAHVAGSQFSSAIEIKFSASPEEAERLKRESGLDPTKEDGKVYLAIEESLGELLEYIRKVSRYCARIANRPVSTIVLSGGSSMMPGMVEYFASNIEGTRVLQCDMAAAIDLSLLKDSEQFAKDATLFAVAAGAAMRGLGVGGVAGINLLGGKKKRAGPGIFSSFAKIFSRHNAMATPKKTSKKSEAAPARKRPTPAAAPTPEPESIPAAAPAPTPAPPAEPAPTFSAPVQESAPSHDYGQGVGQLLGSAGMSDGAPMSAAPATPSMTTNSSSPTDTTPKPTLPKTYGNMSGSFVGGSGKKSHGSFIILILVGVALLVAAVFGVMMFLKRLGQTPGETTPPATNEAAAPTAVSADFVISANSAEPTGDKPVLLSRVIEVSVTAEDTFLATGETVNPDAKATGTVVITNRTDRQYTFVEGTRVLSKDGILFRLKDRTLIPPDQPVEAFVVADQSGAAGDIGRTTFTFPGLPESLQDDVYAESRTSMSGGSGVLKSATAEDIAKAKDTLAARLNVDALGNFAGVVENHELVLPELITSAETEFVGPGAGQPGADFVVRIAYRFRTLLVPQSAVLETLRLRTAELLPAGESIDAYTLGAPTYVVTSFDAEQDRAEIRADASVTK